MTDSNSKNQSQQQKNKSSVKIDNPHDKFVRAAIKNLPVAKDLFISSLPTAIQTKLDLDQLEVTSESHIDENLKAFMSDIIFKCAYKGTNQYTKIPLLIEHQSSPDSLIAFRVHHYLVNFLYSELKRTKAKKLTAAYALVLYHGQETPYPYSTNFIDCFDDPHGIMQHFLSNPVEVIDIGQIPDESLQKRQLLGVIQAALKYSRSNNPEPRIIQIMRQIATLDFSNQRELQLTVKLITNYMFTVGKSINVESVIKAGLELPQPIRGEYMTIAEQLEAIGEARGKKLGEAEGETRGEINKARQVTLNMHKLGLSPQIIAQSTELPLEQVLVFIKEQD